MIRLASAKSVAERIGKSDFVIVDPRRPMKYLAGHLSGAVNLPVYRAFGDNGSLLDEAALAEWLGAGGVGEGVTPVLYDSPQGQMPRCWPGSWSTRRAGGIPARRFLRALEVRGREIGYRPVEAAGGASHRG